MAYRAYLTLQCELLYQCILNHDMMYFTYYSAQYTLQRTGESRLCIERSKHPWSRGWGRES